MKQILHFAFLLLVSLAAMPAYAGAPTPIIPITPDPGEGGDVPKPQDDGDCGVMCYWQDGALYIFFAVPEGDASVTVWCADGCRTAVFSTADGCMIPCAAYTDIISIEIRTEHGAYRGVAEF